MGTSRKTTVRVSVFATKKHGLGLGLSIRGSIIEAHGGTLWAEPAPDQGTIVGFVLPAAPHDA